MLKWLAKLTGPRWELRFIEQGRTRYVMRCNSVVKMLGYLLPAFEEGGLRPGWSIECLSTSKDRTAGLIEPSCFCPAGEGNRLTLSPEFMRRIESIDPGYRVHGNPPEFFATGSAGMMPIPLQSTAASHLSRGDVADVVSNAQERRGRELTFFRVMRTVFAARAKVDTDTGIERKNPSAEPDGCSPETAFVIPASGPAEAVAIEFRVLTAMFGVEGEGWKLHDRCLVGSAAPRRIEKFLIGYKGKRHEVFFDISAAGEVPDTPAVRNVVEGAFQRQRGRFLSIDLPRPSLLALHQIISGLPESAVSPEKMDRKHVEEEMMAACIQSGLMENDDWAREPRAVPVELAILDWVTIVSLLRVLGKAAANMPDDERSLLQEELMEDLRARIEGAVKQAGSG